MPIAPEINLEKKDNFFAASFRSMASPCEVFVDNSDRDLAYRLSNMAASEAARIERKFSRFRTDNIIHKINTSNGKSVEVDPETALLLDFAEHCYELSDGMFDITSGILRRVWTFDRSDNIPEQSAIDALLPLIGWDKLTWNRPVLCMPAGMEIDLGGIGKEYAVDKTLLLLTDHTPKSILVNFGGDLNVSGPRSNDQPWLVGVEKPDAASTTSGRIEIFRGALTTSGDSQRYLKKDNTIYSHVLDPRNGWPVANAPRSVTIAAKNCTEAGILSTLGMLHGADAEKFLNAQGVKFWCQR